MLEIDPETQFVRSFVFEFVTREHKRPHEVSANYAAGELDAEIFEIPEPMRERADRLLSKAREQAKAREKAPAERPATGGGSK